ncbi:heterokaryon incompatibility protein-domain-containing protein [Chaetomium strumarium]|uniref:Heterokaryon incompatibility protein-domain-containing protein n=1 Tax=Chaetomium strumarium TaxID=1170767 RepID=A0AAJ0GPS9_9PEZI|nr:heterokaryon incompatibility protein-domain-containing protein [Chaetomium strumarium]
MGVTEPYVTLSHCWGDASRQVTLTSENQSRLQRGAPISELPATFREAADVTRYLGYRYIWIDSLCIIKSGEGAAEDWAREVRTMASVYRNCVLNLAASDAQSSADGMFRRGSPDVVRPLCADIPVPILEGTADCAGESQQIVGRMYKRAWVCQERLLSVRKVHFTRREILWECWSPLASESFLSGIDKEHTLVQTHRTAFAYDPGEPGESALNCMESNCTPLLKSPPGTWTAHDRAAQTQLCFKQCYMFLARVPAPELAKNHIVTEVVDVHADLSDSQNPYGRVTAGYMVLRGPLAPIPVVTCSVVPGVSKWVCIRGLASAYHILYFDAALLEAVWKRHVDSSVNLMPIAWRNSPTMGPTNPLGMQEYGLILLHNDDGIYRRIGIFHGSVLSDSAQSEEWGGWPTPNWRYPERLVREWYGPSSVFYFIGRMEKRGTQQQQQQWQSGPEPELEGDDDTRIVDEAAFREHYRSLCLDPPPGCFRKPSALVDIMVALCMQYGMAFLPYHETPVPANGNSGNGGGGESGESEDASSADDGTLAGWRHYQRCRALVEAEMERPTLSTVQCLSFCVLYLRCASFQNTAHHLLALAVRIACTLGLCRELPPHMDILRPEKELRKRLWWTIYLTEAETCMKLGRPWSTADGQMSCSLPVDDHALALRSGGSHTASITVDGTTVTWLTYTLQNAKLVLAARDVTYDDGAAALETVAADALRCGMDGPGGLAAWLRDVPTAMKMQCLGNGLPFSTDLSRLDIAMFAPAWLQRQRLFLELLYHTFMINLHRPFIAFPAASKSASSSSAPTPGPLAIAHATTAACHCIVITAILRQILTETDLLRGWYEAFQQQWNAATTMIGFLLVSPKSPVPSGRGRCLGPSSTSFSVKQYIHIHAKYITSKAIVVETSREVKITDLPERAENRPTQRQGRNLAYATWPQPPFESAAPGGPPSPVSPGWAESPTGREASRPQVTPSSSEPLRFERPNESSHLKDLPFAARLAAAGKIHVYAKTRSPRDYNIYLSSLQRMVICQLQKELAEVVRKIYASTWADKDSMDKAKQLLTDYTNAIRDYDFMTEKLKQSVEHGEQDPFQISTTRTLEALLMDDAGLIPKAQPPSPPEDRAAYERRQNILPGVSRSEHQQASDLVRFLERLGMGLGGGVALIVPMLVMVLRDDVLTQLLTTTVATMLFAASVAAYAAVLVVFIGASS